MFNTKALMSSHRMDWKTPKQLYEALDKIFNFDFDPCPQRPNFDGLSIDWGQCNYVNPPYGSAIKHWIQKGFEESQKGKTVVMLIPSRTDTKYWHDYVMKGHEIWFVKGRLKFDGFEGSAPFPSAIVIFKGSKGGAIAPTLKSVGLLAQFL